MKVGLVGFPNVGKSTIYNLLSGCSVPAKPHSFCTIKANSALVPVPDKRLDELALLSRSKKVVYNTIEYVDIAGLIEGASTGSGKGNQFLNDIAGVHMVLQVVRCFNSEEAPHINGYVDPILDMDVINGELIEWDRAKLISCQKKNPIAIEAINHLNKKLPLRTFKASQKNSLLWDVLAKSLPLITLKPMMILGNMGNNPNYEYMNSIKEFCEREHFSCHFLNALDPESLVNTEFSTLNQVIKSCYETVGLISYFTTGEKETRGWNITKGTNAQNAAGEIHMDFVKGFIKAEVIGFNKFIEGDRQFQTKGKEYIVQDGDIIIFKTR